MNPLSLDTPLLFFSPRDPWTVRDALAGSFCTGATGAGKTSGVGAALSTAFLRAGFGGLIMTAKRNECALWQGYCRATNRTPSLIVFSPSGPWRFNFLDYELRRPGVGAGLTENLVRVFCTLLEAAERQHGQRPAQDFWERTTKQLLRNSFDLLAIARGRIVLHEIYDLIVSAPQSPEETGSETWQHTSFCFASIRQGEAKLKSAQQTNDFTLTVKYWLKEFPALAPKTRSIICTSLTSMLDIFLRGALRELFCTSTNVVPDVTHAGAVLVLDLPILEFGQVGQMAQVLVKYMWQRATERRDVGASPRPVFCWADEAQYFANGHDSVFQSTARSSHTATVYLTQNLANFHMVMGQAETLALLGNLNTKICCANGDAATNEWASQTISRTWTLRNSSALSRRDGDTNELGQHSFSQSDSLEQQIQPHDFTVLRKGGPEHNWSVDAVIFQGGRIWRATRKNFIKVAFPQPRL